MTHFKKQNYIISRGKKKSLRSYLTINNLLFKTRTIEFFLLKKAQVKYLADVSFLNKNTNIYYCLYINILFFLMIRFIENQIMFLFTTSKDLM